MVFSLGIAGSKLLEENNLILLENTYVLQRIATGSKTGEDKSFMNFTKQYVKNVKTSVAMELMEGRLTQELIKEQKLIGTLAASLCRVQMELKRLQLLNIHSFTDSAESILFENKNKVLLRKGDAFLSGKCKAVSEYHIYWNQSYQGHCFSLLPVKTENREIRFLELPTRRILQSSSKIKCSDRDRDVYIKDEKGRYWQFRLGEGFSRMNVSMDHFYQKRLKLPTLKSFDMTLLHRTGVRPHRSTLLNELTNQRENLKQLHTVTKSLMLPSKYHS